jgi:hypothetical protein
MVYSPLVCCGFLRAVLRKGLEGPMGIFLGIAQKNTGAKRSPAKPGFLRRSRKKCAQKSSRISLPRLLFFPPYFLPAYPGRLSMTTRAAAHPSSWDSER